MEVYNMSFINEIRDIQAQTIVKHEEEMRRDNDVVLKVVDIIKERIKSKVSNYLFAKDTKSETITFVVVNHCTCYEYKFSYSADNKIEEIEITAPEYRSIVENFLAEGFKVSQCDDGEEYDRVSGCPGFGGSIRLVRKLTVEW